MTRNDHRKISTLYAERSEFSLENEVFKSNLHAGKMTTHRGKMSHTFVAAISGPLCALFAFVCLLGSGLVHHTKMSALLYFRPSVWVLCHRCIISQLNKFHHPLGFPQENCMHLLCLHSGVGTPQSSSI